MREMQLHRIHEDIMLLRTRTISISCLNFKSKFKPLLLLGAHCYYLLRANMPNHRFYSVRFSTAFILHSGVTPLQYRKQPLLLRVHMKHGFQMVRDGKRLTAYFLLASIWYTVWLSGCQGACYVSFA